MSRTPNSVETGYSGRLPRCPSWTSILCNSRARAIGLVNARTIQAPLPGAFYRSRAPGEIAFKAQVTRWVGDTVGLIEVMKSLTPVVAERGEIAVRIIRAARDWASGPCKR